jgi:hypothetical protein
MSKPKDLPLWTKGEKQEPIIRERPPNPDELALGWAAGKDDEANRDVVQLKGIPQDRRDAHFYVVGATRSGKTKFLESLIKQDIENGFGFGVIDPHGDFTEDLKGYLYALNKDAPELLRERVVLIDPTDKTNVATFNPLEVTGKENAEGVVLELTDAFKKIWHEAWGARMEDLLKNTLIALVENNLTLGELPLFLTNAVVRRKILSKVKHEGCRQYFAERFDNLRRNEQDDRMESTLNKVGAFLFDPALRQMLVASKSSFNIREIMDDGKILLVKLAKGQFKSNADLLGSLLLAKIQATAFARTDTPESKRQNFYLYIDEFQNFATESFKEMLGESGKYKLPLTLAHQNLAQLPANLRAAILSNCRLQAYFQISRDDANILAKESLASIYSDPPGWEGYIQELQELPRRACVIKNKIDGGVIAVRTLDLPPPHEFAGMDEKDFAEKVAASEIGKNYLQKREDIEREYRARREALLADEEPASFREEKRIEAVNYEEIIKGGENDYVEFKPSLQGGYGHGDSYKEMTYMITKGISAFMNASGGRLFIGVGDSGVISGIEKEYANVRHGNKDGFLLRLTQVINQYLGKEFHQYTSIKIVPIQGKEVCVVDVIKSKMPSFLNNKGKEEFYVRASASSQPMNMREADAYIRTHFANH